MERVNWPATDAELLEALGKSHPAEADWSRFDKHYRPVILAWARQRLNETDAEEVAQGVLVKLLEKLPGHSYDPAKGRFRNWLIKVVSNAISDYVAGLRRGGQGRGESWAAALLENQEARTDLERRLEEITQWEAVREAMAQVRQRIGDRAWSAFWRQAMEGQPAARVATDLGMSVTAVWQARYRVQAMIRERIREAGEQAGMQVA